MHTQAHPKDATHMQGHTKVRLRQHVDATIRIATHVEERPNMRTSKALYTCKDTQVRLSMLIDVPL